MDPSTTPRERSGNLPYDHSDQSYHHHYTNGEIGNVGSVQTLCVLVSRGYPRDSETTRQIELCIVGDERNGADITYQLKGDGGSYELKVVPNLGTLHSRPNFVRQFHVATVPVTSHRDTKLHELVVETPIHNDNPEWTRWTWIDNVLGALTAAGIISSEEGTEVLDATIDCISDAPYSE